MPAINRRPAKVMRLMAFFPVENPHFKNLSRKKLTKSQFFNCIQP
ncbi:hypothetical protein D1BOALGB6SA_2682 [Olavius sp. associated proteobacterium Delta 1]|nr:hypothetical protein D1BOALGB6SA_2682 [Olavius sp. associated proteobacterium Delta 1]